jgi:hypothetical protein
MADLTKAQAAVLHRLAAINDKGRDAHIDHLRTNKGVLGRLEESGLVYSAAPFSFAFHSVRITAAGLRALTDGEQHDR